MGFKTRQQVKAAELAPGDLTIDLKGESWHVVSVDLAGGVGVVFTIEGGKFTPHEGKRYSVTKGADELVTVVREKSQPAPTPAEAAVLEVFPNAEKVTEVTTTAQEAADAATEAEPLKVAAWQDMSDLEQRTHVFTAHGVVCYDIKPRAELAKVHADLHSGKAKSRTIPHVHEEPK
jgi:hypothetical protein